MVGSPHPLIDLGTARELLTEAAPCWTALLESLEEGHGRLSFRIEFAESIANLRIESYPLLYEKEAAAGLLMTRALFGEEGARSFDATMRTATPEERGAAMREIGQDLEAFGSSLSFDGGKAELEQAHQEFQSLPLDQRAQAIEFTQHMFAGILVLFYQQLSMMVHGERLTALVAQAKAGNDEAFLKAIQIDKRILTKLPYFEARFMRSQLQDERQFQTAVARKLEAPPYVGRITHKKLWLAFAFLESVGLLDSCAGNELLDLLQEVGVIDDERPIDDVKNLLKRKAQYREFQALGGMSTP